MYKVVEPAGTWPDVAAPALVVPALCTPVVVDPVTDAQGDGQQMDVH